MAFLQYYNRSLPANDARAGRYADGEHDLLGLQRGEQPYGDSFGATQPYEIIIGCGVDRDGALNKIGDNDEEWVVEMAVPLASPGLRDARAGTKIPFSIRRCEIGHGHACGGCGDRQRSELALAP